MGEMLVVVVVASLVAALLGACIAFWIQRGYFERVQAQQRGWERAQEGHLHDWEHKQEQRIANAEANLSVQVQHVQQSWQQWEAKDEIRVQELAAQHREAEIRMHVQNEVARLPRVEEAPLPDEQRGHQVATSSWKPPMLHGANLAELNLSHRYLARADLRNAQLKNTNFFMADLAGAILAGANLEGADLSGANLVGADLRGATLRHANLQVADLQGAVLIGANLLEVRNLTPKQLHTAIYDGTTRLDTEIELSLPGLSGVTLNGSGADDGIDKVSSLAFVQTPTVESGSHTEAETGHPPIHVEMAPLLTQEIHPLLSPSAEPGENLHDPMVEVHNVPGHEHSEEFEIAPQHALNGTGRAKDS